jgi:hypothetical protein
MAFVKDVIFFLELFQLFVAIFLSTEKVDKKDFHCYLGYGSVELKVFKKPN